MPTQGPVPNTFDEIKFSSPNEQVRRIGIPLIALGQVCKFAKDAAGNFIAPQFMRHHLSNLFDAAVGASMVDSVQLTLTRLFTKKAGTPRPIASALIAFSVFTAGEVYEAQPPGRHFDYYDESLHALSSAAYVGFVNRRRKKAAEENPQLEITG